MVGNLTTRIKNISNKPCYHYIMKECFNNIDYSNFNKTIKKILNDECIQFIKTMHSIDSSLTGTFFDYLVRRIICEITKKTWTYIRNDDFNSWAVFKEPSIKSDKIISIDQCDNFIVKDKSLLNCNSTKFHNKVDNISIINLLQGYIVNYDISYITKDQMVNYLRFLTK